MKYINTVGKKMARNGPTAAIYEFSFISKHSIISKKLAFTSIQSWVQSAEIKAEGEAAIPPILSPNEIWAAIGVPIAIPVTIMVGL